MTQDYQPGKNTHGRVRVASGGVQYTMADAVDIAHVDRATARDREGILALAGKYGSHSNYFLGVAHLMAIYPGIHIQEAEQTYVHEIAPKIKGKQHVTELSDEEQEVILNLLKGIGTRSSVDARTAHTTLDTMIARLSRHGGKQQ